MERPVVIVSKADITFDYKTNEKKSMELAADAVFQALENAGLSPDALRELDGLATVSPPSVTIEYPITVAQLLNAPCRIILDFKNGGSSPAEALNTSAAYISSGWADFLIVCGGDNIGSFRRTQFNIYVSSVQLLLAALYNQREMDHYIASFAATYAIYGLAHAAKEGIGMADLRRSYAEMISEFSKVAAQYPPSKSKEIVTAEQVLESLPIATPFTLLMCANPRLDQGTALLMMSEDKARSLGISEDRWVYWHGGGGFTDHKSAEDEKDFTEMRAAKIAILMALAQAGIPLAELEERVRHFDIYSCFPAVVQNIVDMLGLGFKDFGRFTQAGGLARRGGAGSLYSLSAYCAMYDRILKDGGKGLIYSLGGASSSHGAVVLGRERVTVPPGRPQSEDLTKAMRELDDLPSITVDSNPEGEAELKTYTVIYENQLKGKGIEPYAVCFGRRDKRQFIANLEGIDPLELAGKDPAEVIGRTCKIGRGEKGTITMTLG